MMAFGAHTASNRPSLPLSLYYQPQGRHRDMMDMTAFLENKRKADAVLNGSRDWEAAEEYFGNMLDKHGVSYSGGKEFEDAFAKVCQVEGVEYARLMGTLEVSAALGVSLSDREWSWLMYTGCSVSHGFDAPVIPYHYTEVACCYIAMRSTR